MLGWRYPTRGSRCLKLKDSLNLARDTKSSTKREETTVTDYFEKSLIMHQQLRGKVGVHNKLPIGSRDDLSIAYTPGVARPCEVIAEDPEEAFRLTIKGNSVAVISDGSAVLGLGDIGPLASLPVMEGKALLFREFAKN